MGQSVVMEVLVGCWGIDCHEGFANALQRSPNVSWRSRGGHASWGGGRFVLRCRDSLF